MGVLFLCVSDFGRRKLFPTPTGFWVSRPGRPWMPAAESFGLSQTFSRYGIKGTKCVTLFGFRLVFSYFFCLVSFLSYVHWHYFNVPFSGRLIIPLARMLSHLKIFLWQDWKIIENSSYSCLSYQDNKLKKWLATWLFSLFLNHLLCTVIAVLKSMYPRLLVE